MFIDIMKMIRKNNAKYDTIKISKISIHDNSVANMCKSEYQASP